MIENKLEIHEQHPNGIVLNGTALSEGDILPKDLGLFEERIDKKLLSILAYLAIQKFSSASGRWVSADEVAFSVLPTTSMAAVSKFLERKVRSYFPGNGTWNERETEISINEIPSTHLIQYMPRRIIYTPNSGGTRHGLSRGPYRLGASIGEKFSINAAWQLILDQNLESDAADVSYFEDGSQDFMTNLISQAHISGDMLSARVELCSYIKKLLTIANKTPGKALYHLQAEAFYHLGNIDMELGHSKTSIIAASRALKIFDFLTNKKGMADTFQLMAHGYGQINQTMKSLRKAEQARSLCDTSRLLKAAGSRTYYVGVLGHRVSKTGNYKQAEKLLCYAQSRCNSEWDMVWSFRRAENFIASGQLDMAEAHLEVALTNANDRTQTIPYKANISRVVTSYFIAVNDFESAEKWLNQAKAIGAKHGFANHMRLVDEIEESLYMKQK